jgi:hypothetical protein
MRYEVCFVHSGLDALVVSTSDTTINCSSYFGVPAHNCHIPLLLDRIAPDVALSLSRWSLNVLVRRCGRRRRVPQEAFEHQPVSIRLYDWVAIHFQIPHAVVRIDNCINGVKRIVPDVFLNYGAK